MTHRDEFERSLLESARRGLGPSAEVAARVRNKAFAAIAAGVPVPDPSPGLLERVTNSAQNLVESLADGPTQARVALGAVLLSTVGLGGYALGVQAGRREAKLGGGVATAPAVVRPVNQELAPAVAAPAPAPAHAAAPESVSSGRRHESAARVAASAVAPPPPEDPEAELRALRRIERVLREHNPRLALALLADLDRDLPQGKLLEERETARVVANCELDEGATAARDRAAKFAVRYPNSVYASRVEHACGIREPEREQIEQSPETNHHK
jgi:hypothetical protein